MLGMWVPNRPPPTMLRITGRLLFLGLVSFYLVAPATLALERRVLLAEAASWDSSPSLAEYRLNKTYSLLFNYQWFVFSAAVYVFVDYLARRARMPTMGACRAAMVVRGPRGRESHGRCRKPFRGCRQLVGFQAEAASA